MVGAAERKEQMYSMPGAEGQALTGKTGGRRGGGRQGKAGRFEGLRTGEIYECGDCCVSGCTNLCTDLFHSGVRMVFPQSLTDVCDKEHGLSPAVPTPLSV